MEKVYLRSSNIVQTRESLELNVINVKKPSMKEFESIIAIDREVIGNDSRTEYIKKGVKEERCLVVESDNKLVGFLIFERNFFNCSFITLVIVSPMARRRGVATALIHHFVTISPTEKIFSSTNQSNKDMQKVFVANGFVQSGVIENLDEGDPEIIYFKSKSN